MEYKYEDIEKVEAKKDFNVYLHGDEGEIIKILIVKKGTKGIIESMGWSSTDGFRKSYDILFTEEDGNEIEVGIYEDKMEEFLVLN